MRQVAVVAYCRTGIAQALSAGALNQTHGIPMTAHVLRHAVTRAGIEAARGRGRRRRLRPARGRDRSQRRPKRRARSGLRRRACPGMTVNRYCGSGLSAASIVANRIATGEATIAIAGGVESISLVQFNLNLNGFFYEPLQHADAGGVVDDEPDRRLRGEEVRHQPRGPGRLRRAEPAARRRGGGRRQVRRGDRPVHDEDEGRPTR